MPAKTLSKVKIGFLLPEKVATAIKIESNKRGESYSSFIEHLFNEYRKRNRKAKS